MAFRQTPQCGCLTSCNARADREPLAETWPKEIAHSKDGERKRKKGSKAADKGKAHKCLSPDTQWLSELQSGDFEAVGCDDGNPDRRTSCLTPIIPCNITLAEE